MRVVAIVLALLLSGGIAAGEAAAQQALAEQVRVSQIGPDGDPAYGGWLDAPNAGVAFNTATRQYFTVWNADDSVNDQFDISGRFLDAAGVPLGPEMRISDVGAAPNAYHPRVAYNSKDNEFLVVFTADMGSGVDEDYEIWGQRVGPNGNLLGSVFRISDMAFGNTTYNADHPQVTYNPQRNEYFVVWHGRDDALGADRHESWGRRVSASGAVAPADCRISVTSGSAYTAYPSVAYNSRDNEYMVALQLYNPSGTAVQRLTADCVPVGANRTISTIPSHKNSIVFNPDRNEFLVAWPGVVDGDTEIYAVRLNAGGERITGGPEIKVSDQGPLGATAYGSGVDVGLGYSPKSHQYLLAWRGDDTVSPFVDDEWEVFAQALDADGNAIGADDFPVSSMGPDGSSAFRISPREVLTGPIAYDPTADTFLLAWAGDDGTPPMVDNEVEVFARRVGIVPPAAAPAPSPSPSTTPQPAVSTPPGRVRARVTYRYRLVPRGTRFTKLVVTEVPSGGKVSLRCRGRGCPPARRLRVGKGVKPPRVVLTKVVRRLVLRPGSSLEVSITARGMVGKVVRYTARRGAEPRSRVLCVQPGKRSPGRC